MYSTYELELVELVDTSKGSISTLGNIAISLDTLLKFLARRSVIASHVLSHLHYDLQMCSPSPYICANCTTSQAKRPKKRLLEATTYAEGFARKCCAAYSMRGRLCHGQGLQLRMPRVAKDIEGIQGLSSTRTRTRHKSITTSLCCGGHARSSFFLPTSPTLLELLAQPLTFPLRPLPSSRSFGNAFWSPSHLLTHVTTLYTSLYRRTGVKHAC
ncbi:hypothetical protein O988_06923 [Pseudogymnoascus sp. VKM F-3808]|nr:hypothetical protein O988_06923 [Pseudogymnoascus sp. VKM F-3808]